MIKFDENLLRDCLETWGSEPQLTMVQEECGELITAVSRYFRGRDSELHNVLEELADVLIISQQIVIYLGEDIVQAEIDRKQNRVAERLHEHKNRNRK